MKRVAIFLWRVLLALAFFPFVFANLFTRNNAAMYLWHNLYELTPRRRRCNDVVGW